MSLSMVKAVRLAARAVALGVSDWVLSVQRRQRSFGELAEDWLKRVASQRACPENERRHIQHLWLLWPLREAELTKAAVEEAFAALATGDRALGAATLNKLRSTGRLVVADAQANGLWMGPNPFALVRRRKAPQPVWLCLSLDEARRLVDVVEGTAFGRLVKSSVLMGLRPGESLGMRREDVDFAADGVDEATILVRRSHGRAQTKTGVARRLPLHAELLEDFRAALADGAVCQTPYVFPGPCGERQAHHRLTEKLRRALGAVGVSKALRFYDLRHTSATLHRQAGADPLAVQLLLGHVPQSQTDATYTHVDPEWLRAQLGRLSLTTAR